MSIFTIIMIVVSLVIFIGFIILVNIVFAAILIPPLECPDCHTKMEIIMSNIYTGQVLYKCPYCGKRVIRHYDENELVREDNSFTCPFNHHKSKTDNGKER